MVKNHHNTNIKSPQKNQLPSKTTAGRNREQKSGTQPTKSKNAGNSFKARIGAGAGPKISESLSKRNLLSSSLVRTQQRCQVSSSEPLG